MTLNHMKIECSLAPNKRSSSYNILRYRFSHIRWATIQTLHTLLQKWLGPRPLGIEAQRMGLAGALGVLLDSNGAPAAEAASSSGFFWGEVTGCSG